MRKINAWIIVIFLGAFLVSFQGCATEKVSFKIENSLPQSKLAYYNDSFDKLREDLWEKAGLLFSEKQLSNFKSADISIENGQLKIATKTGCFSKGGLGSKYTLRGDFDIQMDCHIDFLEGLYDMDQMLQFLVFDKGKEIQAINAVIIGFSKRGKRYKSYIFSGYAEKGVYHRGNSHQIDNFHGTLRIIRIGNEISTLYKKEGENDWKKMNTFRSTANDVLFGFRLQNFTIKRASITARSSLTAKFDNFRINAAQEIIEAEI